MNGLQGLIDRLTHERIPKALATSAPKLNVEHTLAELDLADAFPIIVRGDEVARGKPAPDPFLAACQALHVKPAAAVAIEDSVAGVTAAVAARVGRVVAVTTTTEARLLRDAGAHQVVGSLEELV